MAIETYPKLKNVLSPSEIDRTKIIAQNRHHCVYVVNEAAPLFDHLIDTKNVLKEIQVFPNSSLLNSVRLLRLVNLSILLRLSMNRN